MFHSRRARRAIRIRRVGRSAVCVRVMQVRVRSADRAENRAWRSFSASAQRYTKFMGLDVVDGDDTDIRHIDPIGAAVALYANGKARQDRSGFVIH